MILPEPNIWTYANGITGSVVFIVGYIVGTVALFRYLKDRHGKRSLPYIIILGYCMGTFYLDITLSFLTVLFTHSNLVDPLVSGWIAFTPAAPIIIILVQLGTKLFLRKLRIIGIILLIIVIPSYLFILYWVPIYFGTPNLVLGGFVDSHSHLVKHQAGIITWIVISGFLLLCLVIFGGGFHLTAKTVEGDERKRCKLISWGFIIFSIANFIDMTLPAGFLTTIILIPTRISLAISYYLLYQGFLHYKT